MLSALLRAAFLVSAFRRVELCWSRALLARREGGTRAEGPRGTEKAQIEAVTQITL